MLGSAGRISEHAGKRQDLVIRPQKLAEGERPTARAAFGSVVEASDQPFEVSRDQQSLKRILFFLSGPIAHFQARPDLNSAIPK